MNDKAKVGDVYLRLVAQGISADHARDIVVALIHKGEAA